MLDACGLWEKLERYYEPLRLPSWQPKRVMSVDEEKRLFNLDLSDPDIELAYLVAAITNNTTASGAELRNLQLQHVVLDGPMPELRVRSETAKNEYRARRIPLNDTALLALQRCYARALRLGSCRDEDYLFPFRTDVWHYDPTKPASRSWIRHSWGHLRRKSGIAWLRPHDLRHQAITRMLEAGTPEQTVIEIAGHVSKKMMQHYSHIRMEAKRNALAAIDPGRFAMHRPKRRAFAT